LIVDSAIDKFSHPLLLFSICNSQCQKGITNHGVNYKKGCVNAIQTKNSTLAKCFITINTLALLLAPAAMQADDALWSGSTSDLWSLPDNWVGSPPVPGTGNTATFNSAGGRAHLRERSL